MAGERLIGVLDRLGINHALALLARRPGLLGLAYHRIGTAAGQPFDDELFSATPDAFRAQLLFLRAHFDVLSAGRLLDAVDGGHLSVKRPAAIVTFDDGYRDNCDVAMPILRDLGLPAVFFIAAGYIDEPRLTWWDRVAFIIKQTGRARLELDYPVRGTVDLRAQGRLRAIRQILRVYKQAAAIDQSRFFEGLEHAAGVRVDTESVGRDLFMSWDQVRELKRAGMDVGAHTFNHPVLSRLPEDAQRYELTRSRQRLEAETGAPVRLMAYPVGGRDAFTEVTKGLARDVGYRAAFSYYGGFNGPGDADLFDLRRVSVERSDSMATFRFRASTSNLLGRALL
jgi:peptidoglycan/xylan/chitin deacetylase (PgdA/CDA1 family)